MKKILAFALSSVFAVSGAVVFSACAHKEKSAPQDNLYFVPGIYVTDGVKVENSLSSGATKLSDEVCAEMNTENVYRCTLPAGANLPVPTSKRKDKDDNLYTFNGWWAIVNATVTYYEKVPTVAETTFLYADWRADLSQRKDPVIPDAGDEVEPVHYMSVKHASGDTERITLRKAYTNMTSAETLGYLFPVELYAEGFELNKGDVISVYTTGLTDSEKAVISPVLDSNNTRSIQLEKSTQKENDTADYLTADPGSQRRAPTVTYKPETAGTFNIYIKYFNKGSIMAVYLEPKD